MYQIGRMWYQIGIWYRGPTPHTIWPLFPSDLPQPHTIWPPLLSDPIHAPSSPWSHLSPPLSPHLALVPIWSTIISPSGPTPLWPTTLAPSGPCSCLTLLACPCLAPTPVWSHSLAAPHLAPPPSCIPSAPIWPPPSLVPSGWDGVPHVHFQ